MKKIMIKDILLSLFIAAVVIGILYLVGVHMGVAEVISVIAIFLAIGLWAYEWHDRKKRNND